MNLPPSVVDTPGKCNNLTDYPALYQHLRSISPEGTRFYYIKKRDDCIEIVYGVLRAFESGPAKRHGWPCRCSWGVPNKDYYPYECFWETVSAYAVLPEGI
jgi:hypothetical protein